MGEGDGRIAPLLANYYATVPTSQRRIANIVAQWYNLGNMTLRAGLGVARGARAQKMWLASWRYTDKLKLPCSNQLD